MQFCAACGTPAGAIAAVPSAVQPAAPPPQSSGSALKIILIILAIVVGLGIVSAGAFGFFVWRVAHSIHVASDGSEVTLNTPQGKISTNHAENFTSSDLGTDIYPGAEPGKGGMRMSLPTGSMVSAVYLTSDSRDKVLAFYKSQFGSNAAAFDTASGSVLTLNKSPQESVVVTITAESSENNGKTQIHIVHTTSSKPS
jgi:hypothetical protein